MQPIALNREREEAALHRKDSDVKGQQAVRKAPGCEARTFRLFVVRVRPRTRNDHDYPHVQYLYHRGPRKRHRIGDHLELR